MTQLDQALFQGSGWFVIDAKNQRVPGVVVTSAEQGLDLIGRGLVASVVGRLVDDIRAVDVDLTGERGHAVTETIAAWCRDRGLWHLVRPSGGGEGRAHVLVAVGGHGDGLSEHLEQLRTRWRASRTTIDLRSTLRPLSAPHRTGGWTAPLGHLTTALTTLRRATTAQQGRTSQAHDQPPPGSGPPRSPSVGLLPRRHRGRRDLPAPWEKYLSQGVRPDIAADQPASRSNYEALATAHLLWAGHDPQSAWSRITTAHPKAFTKARAKGRTWWTTHVWDPAVRADDNHTGPARPDDTTAAAIGHARAQLTDAAWGVPERSRPYFLIIGHTVLDRMERTGHRRIPVPERDLVLDTALTDRRTIRQHLARLERTGVLRIHRDTLDPAERATTSYEAEIPAAPDQVGGQQQIPPPGFHTPSPERLPEGCPAHTWLLLRALTEDPFSPTDLAVAAQMSRTPELTPGQQRTLRCALTWLAQIGLARCDEHGRWRRGPGLDPTAAHQADIRQQQLRAAIEAERADYRAPRPSSWRAQQALAHKRQRAKEVAWWRALSPAERSSRRAALEEQFSASSVQEQHTVKTSLVRRQRRLGLDPVRRHQAWVAAHANDERRLERAESYAALPPPLQVARARAWHQHRADHGIPRDLQPRGRIERELSTVVPTAADGLATPEKRTRQIVS
ncbi:hypothetical protein BJF86_13360 [Serinicoccus sp. CNJ-927]|uniref:hypothetical protein n=1 Tax=Serinicoccus sp. CNJ-927 TaxID=1904970 RepID=UPI000964ADC0|nr:hypothetical protein [Serinicoccus sp. CNJ-927]OLT43942.1 hypothetical protein BJF86_13360 [Serinicoccus sp. CNJ-927]